MIAQKNHGLLVACRLKRCFILLFMRICCKDWEKAIKKLLLWKSHIKSSRPDVLCKCCEVLQYSENFAKFTYSNTCTGVFFLKKLQALGKNTFLMEYLRLLLTNIPLKSYSQNFSNILGKTPMKKYCFNNVSDSRPKLKL